MAERLDARQLAAQAGAGRRRDAAIDGAMSAYTTLLAQAWQATQEVFGEGASPEHAFRLVDAWLRLSEPPRQR